MLTVEQRAAILDDQIERFAWDGWRVLHRTPTTAQLTHAKRISIGAAIFWALFLLVGLLIYLLVFLSRRDPIVRLIVREDGKVEGDFGDDDDAWPKLPGDRACPACAYPNSRQHRVCCRCKTPL